MVLIVGLMLTFVWNYRRRPGVEAEHTTTHHTPLELLWTIIPTILVIIIFYFGISGYVDIRTPPSECPRGASDRAKSGTGASPTPTAWCTPSCMWWWARRRAW